MNKQNVNNKINRDARWTEKMTKWNEWDELMKLIHYILGEECCGLVKFTILAKFFNIRTMQVSTQSALKNNTKVLK
jgi:hypothetical protein